MLDSGVEYINSDYGVNVWSLSEKLELNTAYTITLWGKLADVKTGFLLCPGDKGNDGLAVNIPEIREGVYSAIFIKSVWTHPEDDFFKIQLFALPREQVAISTIHRIKLEKGENHNPVWTPAPQDITSLYTRIATLETKVNQIAPTP